MFVVHLSLHVGSFYICAIFIPMTSFPFIAQKLFPFPCDSHGNFVLMGIPIPMHTSKIDSALICIIVHGRMDRLNFTTWAPTGMGKGGTCPPPLPLEVLFAADV